MHKLELDNNIFGDLNIFINDNNVTDILWNGSELWITDLKKGKYVVPDCDFSENFISQIAVKISNLMNCNFNLYTPVLEAETDTLRLSFFHESMTNTGLSMAIRKTLPIRRLTTDTIIQQNYCTKEIYTFLQNAVKAHLNFFIVGETGAGKTEFIKYLTSYIPDNERVITIEDSLEIRYRQINPGKDCVELKINQNLNYPDAIKAALRQYPKWILLSEARGEEVVDLFQSLSSGAYCMTTIHTNDVLNIPSRILNMLGNKVTSNTINDIYTYVDIGILVKAEDTKQGIKRHIAQVCVFSNEAQENIAKIIYDNETMDKELPLKIKKRFIDAKITDPFSISSVVRR